MAVSISATRPTYQGHAARVVRAETDSEIFYIISSSASPGNRIREPAQARAASSRGWVAAPPLVVGGHVAGDCVPNLVTSLPPMTLPCSRRPAYLPVVFRRSPASKLQGKECHNAESARSANEVRMSARSEAKLEGRGPAGRGMGRMRRTWAPAGRVVEERGRARHAASGPPVRAELKERDGRARMGRGPGAGERRVWSACRPKRGTREKPGMVGGAKTRRTAVLLKNFSIFSLQSYLKRKGKWNHLCNAMPRSCV